MKTKDIIGAGLCTILLGSTAMTQAQTTKNDSPKNKIEVVADQNDKNTFIGPEGNYSLKKDPQTCYLVYRRHQTYDDNFNDMYYGKGSWMLVIQRATRKEDLDSVYHYFAPYAFSLNSVIQLSSNQDTSMRIESEKDSKKVSVGNYKGFQTRNEVWINDDDTTKPVDQSLKYASIDIYLHTIFTEGKYSYGITFLFRPRSEAEDSIGKSFYRELINSFQLLKK